MDNLNDRREEKRREEKRREENPDYSCLICDSKNIDTYPAKFSDFISKRVFDNLNKDFVMCHCHDCGFGFYSYRFNDDEVNKLYKDYRTSSYQKQRQECESWYTEDINRLIGANDKEIISRNTNLTNILQRNIDISKIRAVLDYGGDTGLFIPDVLNHATRYVYDISGRETKQGIIKLNSIEKEFYKKFDLILCAHVLEHINFPNELIIKIKEIMNPGQYLYVELPFDSPFYKNFWSNIQYLFNPYYSLKNIFKQFIKIKRYKGYMMHEHINYFTKESVEKLLINNGFNILECGIHKIESDLGNSKIISALCVL